LTSLPSPRGGGPGETPPSAGHGSRASRIVVSILIASVPFAATLLFGYLIAESVLNFGSGEKDLFLVLPALLWSLIFALALLVFRLRGARIARSTARAAIVATVLLVLAWLGLLVLVTPGIHV